PAGAVAAVALGGVASFPLAGCWARAAVAGSRRANAAPAAIIRFMSSILSWRGKLVGRVRANRERMHRMRNQITDAVQHCTMACETRKAEEVLGHDRDRKVPAAGFAAGVSRMLRAVVLDIEHRGLQLGESRVQRIGNAGAHGAGSDTWRASTTPCANANSRNNPMPPHT